MQTRRARRATLADGMDTSSKRILRVRFYLLPTEDGGRSGPIRTGHRSLMRLEGTTLDFGFELELGLDCSATGLAPGVSGDALLHLWAAEELPDVPPGRKLEIREGGRIVGTGIVRGEGRPLDQDLELIDRLHRKDMEAARNGDFETLRSLMTDDAVILPPGGPTVRGRQELDAKFNAMQQGMEHVEVLEYALDFEEVRVLGDYAFEWGTIRGSMRAKGGAPEPASYKVMRILKREPGGAWRVHRSIWNDGT